MLQGISVTNTRGLEIIAYIKMTELKKNNKRSVETSDKKPSFKKLKPSEPLDKSLKPKYGGKPKFGDKKKFGKPSGKFNKLGDKFSKPQQQQPPQGEKTNWSELKQKKKDLKIQRKKNKTKDLYDIDVKAKKIYEELKM